MDKNSIKLNIKKSPVDERDFIAETIHSAEGEVPATLDLRPDLQPIRNQGQQGTCAAQTSACMKEWQEKKDYGFDEYMSPQFIYNNRRNQDSSGMFSRDVMSILHKVGSVSEHAYVYGTFDPISDELKKDALKHVIKAYATILSATALKRSLCLNGPCYIAFPVYNYGPRMWKPEQGELRLGGHAVTVVGYNEEGFILRNSWGSNWGDDGYTIFPYEDWGLQWEVWTAIDDESEKPLPPKPEPKRILSWWKRLVMRIKTFFKTNL